MKDLYFENYKIWWKWFKTIQINRKVSHVHGLEELILLKYPYTQSNLQIQCNPHQITHDIFHRTRKHNPKICMEPQKTSTAEAILRKKEQSWKYSTLWYENMLHSRSNPKLYGTGAKTDVDKWDKIEPK